MSVIRMKYTKIEINVIHFKIKFYQRRKRDHISDKTPDTMQLSNKEQRVKHHGTVAACSIA